MVKNMSKYNVYKSIIDKNIKKNLKILIGVLIYNVLWNMAM